MASRSSIWIIIAFAILCVACQKAPPPTTGDSADHIVPPELWTETGEYKYPPGPAVESNSALHPHSTNEFYVFAGVYPTHKEAKATIKKLEIDSLLFGIDVELNHSHFVCLKKLEDESQAKALQQELIAQGWTDAFITNTLQEAAELASTLVTSPAAGEQPDTNSGVFVDEAPFCDQRELLPLTKEAMLNNPSLLPEDTQARDPALWIDKLNDPGCLLVTEEECRALLKINPEKRREFTQKLNNLQDTVARLGRTIYAGSYRDCGQAELAAAQAGRCGIVLEVQPDAAGGWIAVAPACAKEVDAGVLERQLAAAGLENTARMKPSADLTKRISDLKAALRMLDEQDEIARVCLKQYGY